MLTKDGIIKQIETTGRATRGGREPGSNDAGKRAEKSTSSKTNNNPVLLFNEPKHSG